MVQFPVNCNFQSPLYFFCLRKFWNQSMYMYTCTCKGTNIRQAPVFTTPQSITEKPSWKFIDLIWMSFFDPKMNYNYTACCWFPVHPARILILLIFIMKLQYCFHHSSWQIRFESYWLHCSKVPNDWSCFLGR